MNNYVCVNGVKIELSEEDSKKIAESFSAPSGCLEEFIAMAKGEKGVYVSDSYPIIRDGSYIHAYLPDANTHWYESVVRVASRFCRNKPYRWFVGGKKSKHGFLTIHVGNDQ